MAWDRWVGARGLGTGVPQEMIGIYLYGTYAMSFNLFHLCEKDLIHVWQPRTLLLLEMSAQLVGGTSVFLDQHILPSFPLLSTHCGHTLNVTQERIKV